MAESPASIIPLPSLAHDGRAFGVVTSDGSYLQIDDEVPRLPGSGPMRFHPGQDLVGISGQAALVAPRSNPTPT